MSARDAKNSLVISVLLPQNADSDEIQNTITRYLAKNKVNLTKLIAEHEIRLISNKTVKYPGIELAQEQNGVLNSVTTAQNDFNNHYAMLSEDQRTAYNMVMAIQYPDTFEMPVMERSKPEISKKTFAAGIIFGAFIYGALLGLILLLRRRVISVEDTKYYPGISNLFEFNNYTEKTGLLNSRAVSKFRRKRVPIERQVDSCVEEISLLCSGNKLDKVTILSPGTMAEKCDILIKEVSRKLTAEGIKVSVMELEDTDMVVDKRKLTESSPVIPVIVEDKTKLDGFNSLMNLCNYLNCKVIGTIYYGEK